MFLLEQFMCPGLSHGAAEERWWWEEEMLDLFLFWAKFGASFTKLLKRGPNVCVRVCVCAIITTFSKHLQPPGLVFLAGNRDGLTRLEAYFGRWEGKQTEGRKMTKTGCTKGKKIIYIYLIVFLIPTFWWKKNWKRTKDVGFSMIRSGFSREIFT